MCCSLLQLTDKDPKNRRTFEGSHLIVTHGAQYWSLFPEITVPCNHRGLLIDATTGEPYPMAVAGDFCLEDAFFPGSPGDSLLFNEDDLSRFKRKGFCVSTYREEKPMPTTSTEDKHQSSASWKMCRVPPVKRGNHVRSAAGPRGLLCPRSLIP